MPVVLSLGVGTGKGGFGKLSSSSVLIDEAQAKERGPVSENRVDRPEEGHLKLTYTHGLYMYAHYTHTHTGVCVWGGLVYKH